MHVSTSGNYSRPSFIGDLAFIITLASNPEVYHRYYPFCVNVKLLISFCSMRWHQDSCTKQDNLQMYSSNRCPAKCCLFGETTTHVVLKTQLATAFYRTLRRCKNYFCLVRLLQICTKQNHQVFRMARLVRATGI